jgi:hypothetical protein
MRKVVSGLKGPSMTIAIELTDEEEARLRRSAKAEGKNPEEFLRSLIARLPEQSPVQPGVTSGALLLEQLRADGALGIWKDRADSPELSRALRRRAEKRAGAP